MRTFAVILLLLAASAAPAGATGVLVVGRHGVLSGPRDVPARAQQVAVAGRKGRCSVAARTPLAALLDTRLTLGVKDYGSCGRRVADASALFVRAVAGQRNRGNDGWVFKVRHRLLPSGAADLASRTRGEVLWFFCRHGRTGCQRTLAVTPAKRTTAAGSVLDVKVRAFDDNGKAIRAKGATVTVGSTGASARAGADGVARVPLTGDTGRFSVFAEQKGRVRSFSETVRVK